MSLPENTVKINIYEILSEFFKKFPAINYKLRLDAKEEWDKVLIHFDYVPVVYTNASMDFQLAYQVGHGGDWYDISLIVYYENKPAAIWPLSFSIKEKIPNLSSHGLQMLPPLPVRNINRRVLKSVIGICLDLTELIAYKKMIGSWYSCEFFNNSIGLSEWHNQAMIRGAKAELKHELYIDLSLDLQSIRSGFRNSYKSLINIGLRQWEVGVLAERNNVIWEGFRMLHYNASGRITRSGETWEMQHDHIANGESFLVYLTDHSGEMVGAGLFDGSRDEVMYAVAAYNRSLFDKPLGHVVQFRALEEMKLRGYRWYRVGAAHYETDTPKPNDKELSISYFEKGFATHVFPKYLIKHTPAISDSKIEEL